MGVGGVNFPGKKRYEGVRFNVISVTRGWVGVKFWVLQDSESVLSPVCIIQIGHHRHNRLAPLSGATASSVAIFQTNKRCDSDAIANLALSGNNFLSLSSVSPVLTPKASRIHTEIMLCY